MADNYLERRMDDYRSGRLNSRPAPRVSIPGNALVLRYPPFAVLVITGGSEYDAAVVGQMCRAGLKVSFVHADVRKGTELAQKSGARFYPATMGIENILADMARRRAPASLMLTAGDRAYAASGSIPAFAYAPVPGLSPEASARLLLLALHPDWRSLLLSDGFKGLYRIF